ncbi:hypothetical protein HPB52_020215 [Rhipicephalus sanguineus]|uniref:PLD-like domain-containing protein n=1 Tax=Rhipicephalus sanguineus TaxID=34632 RepID=A0A9D4PGC9_RHISA|nr:hypothetical protein HPB52_020215 [Rhipicephalus sanguineus]
MPVSSYAKASLFFALCVAAAFRFCLGAVYNNAGSRPSDSEACTLWSVIDDALRRAAVENGVRVRLLVSKWSKTKPVMWNFVESLASLNTTNISIEVKAMMIPAFTEEQRKTPYARVNHQKMMITDTAAYIGIEKLFSFMTVMYDASTFSEY